MICYILFLIIIHVVISFRVYVTLMLEITFISIYLLLCKILTGLFIKTDSSKSHNINITGYVWDSPNKIAAQLEKPLNNVKIIR